MTTVPSGYAAWLKSQARFTTGVLAGAAAAWGDKAVTSTNITTIAYKADADAEVVRQTQFLAGPIARDRIVVKGLRSDLIGQLVAVFGDRFGYEAGVVVFVIGCAESDTGNTTTLTVLKRV